MLPARGYATHGPTSKLEPFNFSRREPGPNDVLLQIDYCGICRIAGSIIGGIRETQEMLDFCGKHNIPADIEVIPIQDVEKAFERTVKGDVRYRFVVDMKTL